MDIVHNIGQSVLSKLKNKAINEGVAFQQLLTLFLQDEFIRRLSQNEYRDKLILKGGFLLYALSDFASRPTIDADYLLSDYPNKVESILSLVHAILLGKTGNDYIRIEVRDVEKINEINEYHGIRIYLLGQIEKTKTPFYIDFGIGDVIVPFEVKRTIPVLLEGFEQISIFTYSIESIISEKFDAMISYMEANGRMKDFYDVYTLAITFCFDGSILKDALYKTLFNRHTLYGIDSAILLGRLIENENIKNRWKNFCNKVLRYDLDFALVIGVIIKFIDPLIQSIESENVFLMNWNPSSRRYE